MIGEMSEEEFARKMLVLVGRNALGHVLASQRGMTVGWAPDREELTLRAYFDREPNEVDVDSVNEVAAQVEAVIGYSLSEQRFVVRIEAESRYSETDFAQLEDLGYWTHFRDDGADVDYAVPGVVAATLQDAPERAGDGLFLAVQQALVARVRPTARKITAGLVDGGLRVRAYTGSHDDRQERLLEAAARDAGILLGLSPAEADCVPSDAPWGELESFDVTVYQRYEPEMGYFETAG